MAGSDSGLTGGTSLHDKRPDPSGGPQLQLLFLALADPLRS